MQKYAFMGNRDVPEWLLAEVATLSRIVRSHWCSLLLDGTFQLHRGVQTCVRLKLICKQVLNELLGGKVDFAKVWLGAAGRVMKCATDKLRRFKSSFLRRKASY